MIRFIMPIILIGITILLFFMYTNPIYNEVLSLNSNVASHNKALDNSKLFENERDKLTSKYNLIEVDNLAKLKKLLPDNVDNIRLILEIEQIALPYGMVLKDVRYNKKSENNVEENGSAKGAVIKGSSAANTPKDYGIFDLEFSVSGSYNNFINFTKDLESNLRIVDISSITFSSNTGATSSASKISSSEIYKYNFKIKTYWLKN